MTEQCHWSGDSVVKYWLPSTHMTLPDPESFQAVVLSSTSTISIYTPCLINPQTRQVARSQPIVLVSDPPSFLQGVNNTTCQQEANADHQLHHVSYTVESGAD